MYILWRGEQFLTVGSARPSLCGLELETFVRYYIHLLFFNWLYAFCRSLLAVPLFHTQGFPCLESGTKGQQKSNFSFLETYHGRVLWGEDGSAFSKFLHESDSLRKRFLLSYNFHTIHNRHTKMSSKSYIISPVILIRK